MSEHAAFLAAVIAEPDDDRPRLIYADWLDEHGEPDRAEFIRVQVGLATDNRPNGSVHTGPAWVEWHNRVEALRKRERELLDGILGLGVEAMPIVDGLTRGTVPGGGYGWYIRENPSLDHRIAAESTRGFVSRLTLSWLDWQTHAAALLAACPISRVDRPKKCPTCGGGFVRRVLDAVAYAPCSTCHGTGKVDDWRGDGLVRLTTWPTPFGEPVYLEPDEPPYPPSRQVALNVLASQWPGVRFELPTQFSPANLNPTTWVRGGVDMLAGRSAPAP